MAYGNVGWPVRVSASMSGQRLIPTHEQLAAVVEKTGSFLDYLRDAALIVGAKAPPVPQSAIHYRKGLAAAGPASLAEAMPIRPETHQASDGSREHHLGRPFAH